MPRRQVGPSRRPPPGRVELVEHARDLHAGAADEPAVRVVRGHDQLAGQQLADASLRCGAARRTRRRTRGAGTSPRGPASSPPASASAGTDVAGDLRRRRLEPALRRHVQPVRRRAGGRLPRDDVGRSQWAPRSLPGFFGRVVGDHVRRVVVGEGDGAAGRGAAGCSRRPARRRRRSSRPTSRSARPCTRSCRPARRSVAAVHAGRPVDRGEPGLRALRLPSRWGSRARTAASRPAPPSRGRACGRRVRPEPPSRAPPDPPRTFAPPPPASTARRIQTDALSFEKRPASPPRASSAPPAPASPGRSMRAASWRP